MRGLAIVWQEKLSEQTQIQRLRGSVADQEVDGLRADIQVGSLTIVDRKKAA
jgi:hypothetical protein